MPVLMRKRSAISSLSLTPLIDIVFLLLIFFLVASRFAEEDHELDVDLPTASDAQVLVAKPRTVRVYIDSKGAFYVNRQQLDVEGIERALRQIVANNPANPFVVISADQRCEYQAVVTVLNACNKVGISDPHLSTDGEGMGPSTR